MKLGEALAAELSDRVKLRALQAISDGWVEALPADAGRITYQVRSGENEYLVGLPVDEEPEAPVACDCKAGQNGRLCYHLVAAVAVHFQPPEEVKA
jgi:hypothetical protein